MKSFANTIVFLITWSSFLDISICQEINDLDEAVGILQQEAQSLIKGIAGIGTRLEYLAQIVSVDKVDHGTDLGEAVGILQQEVEGILKGSNAIGAGLQSLPKFFNDDQVDHGKFQQLIPKSAEASDVKLTDKDGRPASDFAVDLSYDGSVEAEYGDCFYSEHRSKSWVKYYIALSKVHFVRVLPRPNGLIAAADYRINVCDGSECTECGLVGELQPYKFKTVPCTGDGSGIFGNVVKLDNPKQTACLTICELEIVGQEL